MSVFTVPSCRYHYESSRQWTSRPVPATQRPARPDLLASCGSCNVGCHHQQPSSCRNSSIQPRPPHRSVWTGCDAKTIHWWLTLFSLPQPIAMQWTKDIVQLMNKDYKLKQYATIILHKDINGMYLEASPVWSPVTRVATCWRVAGDGGGEQPGCPVPIQTSPAARPRPPHEPAPIGNRKFTLLAYFTSRNSRSYINVCQAVAFRANVISYRDQALHIIIPGAAGPGVVYVVTMVEVLAAMSPAWHK